MEGGGGNYEIDNILHYPLLITQKDSTRLYIEE